VTALQTSDGLQAHLSKHAKTPAQDLRERTFGVPRAQPVLSLIQLGRKLQFRVVPRRLTSRSWQTDVCRRTNMEVNIERVCRVDWEWRMRSRTIGSRWPQPAITASAHRRVKGNVSFASIAEISIPHHLSVDPPCPTWPLRRLDFQPNESSIPTRRESRTHRDWPAPACAHRRPS